MASVRVDPSKLREFEDEHSFYTWLGKHWDKEQEVWIKIHKVGVSPNGRLRVFRSGAILGPRPTATGVVLQMVGSCSENPIWTPGAKPERRASRVPVDRNWRLAAGGHDEHVVLVESVEEP
jgi:hypothetical protein